MKIPNYGLLLFYPFHPANRFYILWQSCSSGTPSFGWAGSSRRRSSHQVNPSLISSHTFSRVHAYQSILITICLSSPPLFANRTTNWRWISGNRIGRNRWVIFSRMQMSMCLCAFERQQFLLSHFLFISPSTSSFSFSPWSTSKRAFVTNTHVLALHVSCCVEKRKRRLLTRSFHQNAIYIHFVSILTCTDAFHSCCYLQ